MDFVVNNKWFFLIGAEVSLWMLAAVFLTLRYLFDLNRASFVVLVLIILDNLFIAGLGFLDYRQTGEFATYQFVAVAIVVYGLTFGKQDFRRLDAFLKRRVARFRSEDLPVVQETRGKAGDGARKNRRGWYVHLAAFALGQAAFFVSGDAWLPALLTGGPPADPSVLMNASRLWTIIFVADTLWSLSYTLFPAEDRGQRVK